MADPKTFTEDEHLAILADRVTKETAELTGTVETLTTERNELQNKLDVAESAKAAAEQERDQAKQELTDFRTEVEEREAAAQRKEARLGQVKEVAAHLGDDFFADDKRVERIVAMSDEGFEGYLDDLKATAPSKTTTSSTAPRETAMAGAGSSTADEGKPSAAKELFLGRFQPKGD
jgi:chromosome segregation ATPase